MKICDVILSLRKNRHMTQIDVANGMNISQATVSAVEKGIRKPSYEMLERFAVFFNVPLSEMLRDADDTPDPSETAMAEIIHRSPKLKLLFDLTAYFPEADLDVVLSVASAISKRRSG